MRQTVFQEVVILSAELIGNSDNDTRSRLLASILEDFNLSYSKAIGCYMGIQETSFVVLVNGQSEVDILSNIAFRSFKQESILYQDKSGEAYLIFNDGTKIHLGQLRQTTKEKALKQDGYTILNGEYYTTL